MAKLDESEGEVLSREEMKSTKGGLGAGSEALARERLAPTPDAPKTIITERSLQEESILPASQPAASVTEKKK